MKWILGASLLCAGVRAHSPPINVLLETSWPTPPILLEVLETVYDEEPASYFPLLSLLSSHIPSWDSSSSPEALLSASLDLISSYTLLPQPSALSSLHLALALHSNAPKVEAFFQYYRNYVDETRLGVEDCPTWVEWRGKGFCEVDDLQKDMEMSLEGVIHDVVPKPALLTFDHVSPSTSKSDTIPQAVIYLDLSSKTSGPLLDYLRHHASAYPSFQYIVRYRPPGRSGSPDAENTRPIALGGYGVEMALKKTDYLVVDDRAPTSTGGSVNSSDVLTTSNSSDYFSEILGDDPWVEVGNPITPIELRDIGLQASTLIMAADRPLDALVHLSQNFPKYSAALARRVKTSPSIRARADTIAKRGPTPATLFVNGKSYAAADLNAYSLLKIFRDERHHILSLTSLGLTPRQAFEVISDPLIGQAQTEEDPSEGLLDSSDRLEDGKAISWWNDIEKDKRYKGWPASIQGYMRPMYPGQFHTVKRNTWNLVFVLDLASSPSLEIVAASISTMIQRGIPWRFGVVPMYEPGVKDTSYQMAKVYHEAIKSFGRAGTRDFLTQVLATAPSTPAQPGAVNIEAVRPIYERFCEDSRKAAVPFDELLTSDTHQETLEYAERYMQRLLATKKESPAGHLFVNGKYVPMAGNWIQGLQTELAGQLGIVQEAIHAGLLKDNPSTYFFDLPGTATRRNKLIIPSFGENKLRVVNLLDVFQSDPTHHLATDFVYATSDRGSPLTIWIIGDLDAAEGRRLVEDALLHLQTPECASRLGFVHIPSPSTNGGYRLSTLLYQLVSQSALSSTSPADLLELIREVDEQESNLDTAGSIKVSERSRQAFAGSALNSFTSSGWSVADTAAAAEFWRIGVDFAEVAGVKDSQPHILINGRLIGPVTPSSFSVEDFDALELYELRKRVKPVIDLLRTMFDDISAFDRPTLARIISVASSIAASSYRPTDAEGIFTPLPTSRGRFYENLDRGDLSFTIGDSEHAIIHVAAVLDPVSEVAQKWSSLLQMLSELENVSVTVYLEPAVDVKEIKLKRFYRSSLPTKLTFDVDGHPIAPAVTFHNLPSAPIYTLAMDTPSAWIVSPRQSPHDLDNLLLSSIHHPVDIHFTLKQLVIEGHARELNNAPPRGLQLQLSSRDGQATSDTQVMANLGYLQFKATPGVYQLGIREGRGREVYELESVGNTGWDSANVSETGTAVTLTSFDGITIFPRFTRRSGMERADVLLVQATSPSVSVFGTLFSRIKSLVGISSTSSLSNSKPQAEINIFTVASGLLYERFVSIMVLSVMKHTKSSVKFWFIENFLSPSFLEFIPHLAEEYGFQYELVTYKWPSWLRAQTEKQRIIWAYKILFLDVLFPMDLNKVIFVDADQIVRADMKELVDVDLHGRVYGYAPMGNDRTEMEGFRFWKTGYWKDALGGRPYHISALYVVDLQRFRQLATGDRLRGQYQALSADPNSLANLDQDLPNSMQDQIPIWTLDQDWLWCQTWCSDESLATAKTIDLCQNPLTKEPKLVRARQIPEWDVYDKEVAAFAAKLYATKLDSESAVPTKIEDLITELPATDSRDDSTTGIEEAKDEVRILDEL